ncbi:unnamed protein product [Lota lota]
MHSSSRPSSWEKPFIATPESPLEEQQETKTWLVGASRDTDMFTAIARLLFGGEEKTADDAQPSGEVVDDGWLLLNHRDAVSEGRSGEDDPGSVQIHGTVSTPALSGHSDPNLGDGSGPSESEVLVDRSALIAGVLQNVASQAAALAKVTHASRVQRARAWAERHQLARSSLQRQNCIRQQSQSHRSHTHSSSYLQQPGCRNYTH